MGETAFATLSKVNVNGHTETKKSEGTSLTYLSWTWAWSEVQQRYPDASYQVLRDERTNRPYWSDPDLGIMVMTSVTIEGTTHEMWLPVMNAANKAMKISAYEYTTKYGKKQVEAATMFDVNKAIMRCLTKNLAMFGLGLYIYAGEDLPAGDEENAPEPKAPKKPEEATDQIFCAHCGKPITARGKYSAQFIADRSQKAYGASLCWDCSQLMKGEQQA